MLIEIHTAVSSPQRDKVQDLLERAVPKDRRTRYGEPWPAPNLVAVTEREFWHYAMTYSFDADVYVGNVEARPGVYATVRLYVCLSGHYGTGGFAVVKPYSSSNAEENAAKRAAGHEDPYKWPVEYYTWNLCRHEYEHRSGGNCYHIYMCKHCGHRYDVDSGD